MLALFVVNAQAGLFSDEEARKGVIRLQEKVNALEALSQSRHAEITAQLVEQLGLYKRNLLELNSQTDILRQEIATLRGQNEQAQRDIAELKRKLGDVQTGVSDRLKRFDPVKVTVDGVDILVDPDEKRAFDDAMTFLRQEDFAGASNALQSFENRYPDSGYKNALVFWLATVDYQRKDYRRAATGFRAYVTAVPASPKAPEALLSLAICQTELKDAKASRRTLEELVKLYPGSEAAGLARKRLAGR